MLGRKRAEDMTPDRAFPVELQMVHPVGGLEQGRPRAHGGIGDAHTVCGIAETNVLAKRRQDRFYPTIGRLGRARHATRRLMQALLIDNAVLAQDADAELDLSIRLGARAAGGKPSDQAIVRFRVCRIDADARAQHGRLLDPAPVETIDQLVEDAQMKLPGSFLLRQPPAFENRLARQV